MNRKLIVTLLKKNIQELEMITEGFMEMEEYPKAIILLAEHKIEDIQSYINQLSAITPEETNQENHIERNSDELNLQSSQLSQEYDEQITESDIDTESSDEIRDEIDAALELTSELVEVGVENNNYEEALDKVEFSDYNSEKANAEEEYDKSFIQIPEKDQVTLERMPNPDPDQMKAQVSSTTNETLLNNNSIESTTLPNIKINDIKQAISISDRFRFQRELFRGNGEDMNKTLTYLNLLATLDEAISFLKSKYGWSSDNETAEDFYQIVRRLFL